MSRARITHLKIKIHTLADEASHIRREERKAKQREFYASADKMTRRADSLERFVRWTGDPEKAQAALEEAAKLRHRVAQGHASESRADEARQARLGLAEHRRVDVRNMTRSCLLAYGYLRGTPYSKIEAKHRPDNPPNWREIEKIIKRFGGDPSLLDDWKKGKEVRRAA